MHNLSQYNSNLGREVEKILLSSFSGSTTIDLSSYKNYKEFNNNNFICSINQGSWTWSGSNSNFRIDTIPSFSYNNETGKLTVNSGTASAGFNWQDKITLSCSVYLFDVK